MPIAASSSHCVGRTRFACVLEESCPIEDMYVYSRMSGGRGQSSCARGHGLHARAGVDCPLSIGYLCCWSCRRHLCFKL